ncbi:gp53-like domain-containing protein [Dickeya solani]|uniref:gp53-like domain-containing protein n=1 Tax=Dickeya solani TaxID=1089444 RepID=UPI00070E3CF7
MHRIDTSTAQVDKFGTGKNGFTGGNPQTGSLPTALDQDYCDSIQEEICSVIESVGITLDKDNNQQLLGALHAAFAKLASPAFSGAPTAPTAGFGVTTTQIANMTALHAAKSALSGVYSVSGTNSLTVSAAGALVYMTGGTTFTTTLPTGSLLALGQTITLANYSTVDQAVAANGANIIFGGPIAGSVSSISIKPGASIILVSRGNGEWDIIGGTNAVQYASKLGLVSPELSGTPTAPTAAAGTNSTQLATTAFVNSAVNSATASGLLEQTGRLTIPMLIGGVARTIYIMWGRTAASADAEDTVWTVNFPSAFPTTFLTGQVSLRYPASIDGNSAAYFYNESTSGMNIRLDKYSNAVAGFVAHWLVIGY